MQGPQSAQKDTSLSATDSVRLSVQSNHPAYVVNTAVPGEEGIGELADKEKDSHTNRNKHITVLVISSENSLITLATLDVSVAFVFCVIYFSLFFLFSETFFMRLAELGN